MKKFENNKLLILFGLWLLMMLGVYGGIYIYEHPGCLHDLNYKKACEEKDFGKAYEIVDELKVIASEWKARAAAESEKWLVNDYEKIQTNYENAYALSNEAEKYVILQEAMTVLEENGENGLVRIVGIAKEHNAEGWLYKELLDIAKSIGDSNLIEKIQNLMNKQNSM